MQPEYRKEQMTWSAFSGPEEGKHFGSVLSSRAGLVVTERACRRLDPLSPAEAPSGADAAWSPGALSVRVRTPTAKDRPALPSLSRSSWWLENRCLTSHFAVIRSICVDGMISLGVGACMSTPGSRKYVREHYEKSIEIKSYTCTLIHEISWFQICIILPVKVLIKEL